MAESFRKPGTACPTCNGVRETCKCPKRVAPSQTYASKSSHPRHALYNSSQWRNRTQKTVVALNPVCQRVENGQRCRMPSKVVHHLVGPDQDIRLFFNFANLVALCPQHHNPVIAGEDPREPKDYAPTIGPLPGMMNEHKRPSRADAAAPSTGRDTRPALVDGRIRDYGDDD